MISTDEDGMLMVIDIVFTEIRMSDRLYVGRKLGGPRDLVSNCPTVIHMTYCCNYGNI